MANPQRAKASRSPGPTMDDVAALAGVSPQTVSRTLRGYKHVSDDARKRVLAAVDDLGYRRNLAAAALASGKMRSIGVVALGEGSFRFEVMAGIAEVADSVGYTINMVTTATDDPGDLAVALSRLLDQSVAGVVLALTVSETNAKLDRLLDSVPSIAVNGGRSEWTEAISVDTVSATRAAVRYLLDLGHDTVHYLTAGGNERHVDAWRQQLREANRPLPPVLEGDWTAESGYGAAPALVDAGATAVLAAGDEMAFGILRGFAEAGIRVPEDASVMGSANNRASAWMSPPLTSVEEPLVERGRRAANYLLQRIEKTDARIPSTVIVPRIIERSSTAPRRD